MSKRFPGRKLSLARLAFLIVVLVAVGVGGITGFKSLQDSRTASDSEPWFATYVDVTASPSYAFEQPVSEHEQDVILSFIVAADEATCEASWGGYYSLEEAHRSLDLDRRIARLQQGGGSIVISLGGEANSELALACEDTDDLVDQYRAIIDRYEPAALDLDIEGPALTDTASRERRVEAIATLQEEYGEEWTPVWLTLPVGPEGLTADGVAVVKEFLHAGVDIAGVNAMTMNYSSELSAQDMGQQVIDSLEATHRQVMAIYADDGQPLGTHTAWRKIGATPMIGQNNVASDIFTLDDARELRNFAGDVGLGRMSLWSANRDRTCANAYADGHIMSDSCSGIDQGAETFAGILGNGFTGSPASTVAEDTDSLRPEDIVDDPETSPYPIWSATSSYPAESRVVWRQNVYVSQWWNSAIQPDDPALSAADNPWQLIGPVLPGESPLPLLELPEGHYATWDPDVEYRRGDRVIFDTVAYEAQWWTVGENPASGQADPGSSPWRALSQDEIEQILEEEYEE